jgi:hypothetical protein
MNSDNLEAIPGAAKAEREPHATSGRIGTRPEALLSRQAEHAVVVARRQLSLALIRRQDQSGFTERILTCALSVPIWNVVLSFHA